MIFYAANPQTEHMAAAFGALGGTIPETDGPDAALLRSARDDRLKMINPAHWPTNTYGVLALYDDDAQCFHLTPPHDWPSDEVP